MYNRAKVLDIAKRELGVAEPRGDDKYIRWYNDLTGAGFAMNVAWCAIWVSWVLRSAEIPEALCPSFASCSVCMKWAKKNNVWKDNNYSPLPGDLIMLDWNGKGSPSHVGIVTDTNSETVFTIEGNTSNKVAERSYDRDNTQILGYVAINYGDNSPAIIPSKPQVNTKRRRVAEAQTILRDEYGVVIVIDNAWGPNSKKALIKAVQKSLNDAYRSWLSIDGIWGAKTESAWRNVRNGDSGKLVKLIQIALIAKGYEIEPDGIFGKETLKATKDYQVNNGLEKDGIVGRLTMSKLVK